ncbi:hypothetical protein L1049_026413 [Liquidambar formosana]|uniref:WW domain-containing protein n=1 Tax=Liquidambar formosana TaxID=63359 RepID=A0AAP0NCP8_LIQFO
MVSFHTPLSPSRKQTAPEFENSSKKRKREEPQGEVIFEKKYLAAPKSTKSVYDIELHLETPLPLEWQRCLDIQSGKVHFYNTRTQKRTSRDPRRSPEPPSPGHMSLDLELNLPCESLRKNKGDDDNFTKHDYGSSSYNSSDPCMNSSLHKKNSSAVAPRGPSWLAFEEDQQQEMVATVCKQCFMLVMLCKSSPACPNCKFMHPPDQSPPNLFKRRLGLLY